MEEINFPKILLQIIPVVCNNLFYTANNGLIRKENKLLAKIASILQKRPLITQRVSSLINLLTDGMTIFTVIRNR